MGTPTTGADARCPVRANSLNAATGVIPPPLSRAVSESALESIASPSALMGTKVFSDSRLNNSPVQTLLKAEAYALKDTSSQADRCIREHESPRTETEQWAIDEFARKMRQYGQERIYAITYDSVVVDPKHYPLFQSIGTVLEALSGRPQDVDQGCDLPRLPSLTAYVLSEKKENTAQVSNDVIDQDCSVAPLRPSIDPESDAEVCQGKNEENRVGRRVHTSSVNVTDFKEFWESTGSRVTEIIDGGFVFNGETLSRVAELYMMLAECGALLKRAFAGCDASPDNLPQQLIVTTQGNGYTEKEADLSDTEIDLSDTETEIDIDAPQQTDFEQDRFVHSWMQDPLEQTSDKENRSFTRQARKRGSGAFGSDQYDKRRKVGKGRVSRR